MNSQFSLKIALFMIINLVVILTFLNLDPALLYNC